MAHHILKIDRPYWDAKLAGLKLFEIRCNDRGFQKGDTISYIPKNKISEAAEKFQITYVTGFGQKENWVVFGENRIKDSQN